MRVTVVRNAILVSETPNSRPISAYTKMMRK